MIRSLLVAALVVALVPKLASSNPVPWGPLAPYADPGGTDHYLYDTQPGELHVYIVHDPITFHYEGASGVRFSVPTPVCLVGNYNHDIPVFPGTTGNSQTGVEVLYDTCLPGPIHVLTIVYTVQGLTPECCFFKPEPHPVNTTGEIERYDCELNILAEFPGYGIINPDQRTFCGTPVEDTTWGSVKALFQ